MPEHYNLYYLFLEDFLKKSLPDECTAKIMENIELLLVKMKPP